MRDAGPAAAIDRAVRRARLLTAIESAAVGAVFAAVSSIVGVSAAIVFAVWRSRWTSRRMVVRTVERRHPEWQNLLVTFEEVESGSLAARDDVRSRLEAEVGRRLAGASPVAAFSLRRAALLTILAIVVWSIAIAAPRARSRMAARDVAIPPASNHDAAGTLSVTIQLDPPPYTRLPSTTIANPQNLDVVAGTAAALVIRANAANVTVEQDGSRQRVASDGASSFRARLAFARSGYVLLSSDDGARRMIPVAVRADALPSVRIVTPGKDLVISDGNPRVTIEAEARDDFGLSTLSVRYTKVSGSGEQFTFQEGELPLSIARSSGREWRGVASRTLADFALNDGDMLVYRAVATDNRPGGGESSSDAFFIERSKLGVAAGDAFTLPEQETRYALSEQMLIVKTERLEQRRGASSAADVTHQALDLAVEQRMIRTEFVFMLGGEVEDEEAEAQQSTEIQEGRLANRGQRDVRDATVAMSTAEKLLTAGDTRAALDAERAAVRALQRAFSKDRYILRALATRDPLDFTRRLTAPAAGEIDWRRSVAAAPRDRRAIQLQGLLEAAGAVESELQGGRRIDPRRVVLLGELAIRIDPDSARLRQIAADCQRLADRWNGLIADERSGLLGGISRAIGDVARQTVAQAPVRVERAR